MIPQPQRRLDAVLAFAGHARFTSALTLCIVATGFFAHLLERTVGIAGLTAIVSVMVVLAALSLIARREELEWRGLLPVSLLVFLGWSAISLFWSSYQWATLGSLANQFAFAILAVYVALVRDTIQIIRAFGDVLRVVLGVSLVLEVFSGLLIDTPIRFLGIEGNLDRLGPIQGIAGSRNAFGLIALLALVTFGTELLTASVQRTVGIYSLVTAAVGILLSQSPVSFSVLIVLGIASVALLALRRMSAERRHVWQIGFGVASFVAVALGYLFRTRILTLLDATNEVDYRLRLWRETGELIRIHVLEGWGWIGSWHTNLLPFSAIDSDGGVAHASALNAYLDVWLQLGLVGLVALVVLVGLALSRSWILASRQRSRVFVWPALVLVTLLFTSLAESSLLVTYGWLIVVICSVKASENLSWRRHLDN
jgi:hypothetical protein